MSQIGRKTLIEKLEAATEAAALHERIYGRTTAWHKQAREINTIVGKLEEMAERHEAEHCLEAGLKAW